MVLRLDVNAAQLARALRSAPERIRVKVVDAMRKSGEEFRGEMVKAFGRGDRLHVQTGRLRQSIGYTVTDSGDPQLAVFVSGVPYARVQELGGVITPVRANSLSVPTDENRRSGANLQYPTVKDALARGAFIIPLRKGKLRGLVAFGQRSGFGVPLRDNLEVVFRLVTSVEIPGPQAPTKRQQSRFGFRDTWQSLAPKRQARFSKAIREGIGL